MKRGPAKGRPAPAPPARRDPSVAAIVRAWRALTSPEGQRIGPGEPTLVACSGGADSSALVLALAAATDKIVVGHIIHDFRPVREALADRDAVRDLAASLGLEYAEAAISVKGKKGNAEALGRRMRYDALTAIAAERALCYIATAHHAGDQLESVLMGLVRGAGPAGLRGVAQHRRLAAVPESIERGSDRLGNGNRAVWLIRPMLGVTRADAERICRESGWVWREDATNEDISRLRAAIRHGVARELAALRPGVERRVAHTAELIRDAAGLVHDRSSRLLARAGGAAEGKLVWDRDALRDERAIVLGEVLRRAAGSLLNGRGADRLPARQLDQAVRAIRDGITDPRRFDWHGVDVIVTARAVEIGRKSQ